MRSLSNAIIAEDFGIGCLMGGCYYDAGGLDRGASADATISNDYTEW